MTPVRKITAVIAAVAGIACASHEAAALPAFARQTGEPCATCHTAFPELTPFGRRFKLGGYQLQADEPSLGDHLAAMIQSSFTHTRADQPTAPAPHFGPNDNFDLQQVSVFYGGRIFDHVGAFIQTTFDGTARRFAWDNADLRYGGQGSILGHELIWGLTANNNPSVQDVWNTTPAWSFPYIVSPLAPPPSSGTLIEGGLSQQVAGLGAYFFLDDWIYGELSAYRSLSAGTQTALGIATAGSSALAGTAPYWRVAFEPSWGRHSLEVGTFGLAADVIPQRMSGHGADHLTDVGLDTQYQYMGEAEIFSLRASWIGESQRLDASQALGLSDRGQGWLHSLRLSASATFDQTVNVTGGYTANGGAKGSRAWTGEIAYLPYMHGGPAFWPWLNARIGLQGTHYTRLDGTARRASAADTIFAYVWIAF